MWIILKLRYLALVVGALSLPPAHGILEETKAQEIPGLYPQMHDKLPRIPSPLRDESGKEVIVAFTKNRKYTLYPVTVENGDLWNYKKNAWGKGRQLHVDGEDFPTLAKTGLHSLVELEQTKTITGRSIAEITEDGRPERSSGAGFMARDENIISVLKGDNRLVRRLGLTHPQLAKPLFYLWNIILEARRHKAWPAVEYIVHNDKKVYLKLIGTKGWNESIFNDEVLGMYKFEVWRELTDAERMFLKEKYPDLSAKEMEDFVKRLSFIHTGEMVPYYIMRYGFYEGHTSYRTDPIAMAFIFGFRSLEEIEDSFEGELYKTLMEHFTEK